MAAFSVSEVALRTGHSRAQLYRLLKDGLLKGYERFTPAGRRLLELSPPGLPSLSDRVTACTRLRINSKPKPKPAPDPDHEAFMSRLWGPMTPIVNRKLAAQGWSPMEPDQLLAVHRAIEWGFPAISLSMTLTAGNGGRIGLKTKAKTPGVVSTTASLGIDNIQISALLLQASRADGLSKIFGN